MPDLTLEEADRCPSCDGILYGRGECVHCGATPDDEGNPRPVRTPDEQEF